MVNKSGFWAEEKAAMLALKNVGPSGIMRLEQLGFFSLGQVANQDPMTITRPISEMMGSSCWHNSPQARSAIEGIVELTRVRAKAPL